MINLTRVVGKGDILFTSRHHGLGELGTVMPILSMPDEAGVKLLLHRYGTDGKHDRYMSEGLKIVQRLGNLALAIDQASAYMQYKVLPLDQLHTFLPLYLTQRDKVLGYTTPDLWSYMKMLSRDEQQTAVSAFATWEMSFQQLLDKHENPNDVTHFFTLSAFFGSTFVGEVLFRLHSEMRRSIPSWMKLFFSTSQEVSSRFAVHDTAKEDVYTANSTYKKRFPRFGNIGERFLRRFHKIPRQTQITDHLSPQDVGGTTADAEHISWNSDSFWHLTRQAFQMSLIQNLSPAAESREASFLFHPLIRDWLQLRLAHESRQAFTREAADILCSSIEVYTTKGSDAQIKRMILLHTDSIIACDNEYFADEYRLGNKTITCDNALWIASFYRNQGQYSASYLLSHRALVTRERVLGKEHLDTLVSMDFLAGVLSDQGRYSEAEEAYRQEVKVGERVLGKEHPSTLTSLNNLALLLHRQGKYSEAEETCRRVVEAMQRVLGKEHPSTLGSISNFALVLGDQGKYREAEEMYRSLLEARERVQGKEHPSTLNSVNNLATVLSKQEKYREAEEIIRQVLKVRERVLGKEHPSTLNSMNNLATVLSDQGKYSEAEEIHHHELEVTERALGKEHPHTLTSMNNLATVLSYQEEKYSEAEEMYRQVVELRERVLGKEHPFTLMSINNLAVVLGCQGKLAEAERIQIPAVRSSLVALEPQHPDTELMLDTLEWIWEAQGRETSEIEKMLQDIIIESQPSD